LTLSFKDIQTAIWLLLPGELAKHAISEGIKAVTKFFFEYVDLRPEQDWAVK